MNLNVDANVDPKQLSEQMISQKEKLDMLKKSIELTKDYKSINTYTAFELNERMNYTIDQCIQYFNSYLEVTNGKFGINRRSQPRIFLYHVFTLYGLLPMVMSFYITTIDTTAAWVNATILAAFIIEHAKRVIVYDNDSVELAWKAFLFVVFVFVVMALVKITITVIPKIYASTRSKKQKSARLIYSTIMGNIQKHNPEIETHELEYDSSEDDPVFAIAYYSLYDHCKEFNKRNPNVDDNESFSNKVTLKDSLDQLKLSDLAIDYMKKQITEPNQPKDTIYTKRSSRFKININDNKTKLKN
jgi:hypothetical protein